MTRHRHHNPPRRKDTHSIKIRYAEARGLRQPVTIPYGRSPASGAHIGTARR